MKRAGDQIIFRGYSEILKSWDIDDIAEMTDSEWDHSAVIYISTDFGDLPDSHPLKKQHPGFEIQPWAIFLPHGEVIPCAAMYGEGGFYSYMFKAEHYGMVSNAFPEIEFATKGN